MLNILFENEKTKKKKSNKKKNKDPLLWATQKQKLHLCIAVLSHLFHCSQLSAFVDKDPTLGISSY